MLLTKLIHMAISLMLQDIHDIKISDVVSNVSKYAVMINCEAENISVENVEQNNPCGVLFSEK